jgi:hypothetical protein
MKKTVATSILIIIFSLWITVDISDLAFRRLYGNGKSIVDGIDQHGPK